MKNDKKHLAGRRQWLVLGAALALGMMLSTTGFARPVLGSNSWITYTYFNAQGQIVGGMSQTSCPGMQPFAWGITTNRFTYVTGTCSTAP
jgi:Family of unknown function (DUF6289)